jgi:hypothetical protein
MYVDHCFISSFIPVSHPSIIIGIEFEFKKHRVRLDAYFVAQDMDHYLRNWRIEGSGDNSSWVTLRQHTDDESLTATNRHAFFNIPSQSVARGSTDPTTHYYKKFRIYLTGPSHSGETNFGI